MATSGQKKIGHPFYSIGLILCFSLTGFSGLFAQDSLLFRHITVPDTVFTLESAMNMVEQRTGLTFAYNSGLINRKKQVSLKQGNLELGRLLTRLFTDPGIDFSIIGKHIVIYQAHRAVTVNPEAMTDSFSFIRIMGRVLDKNDRQPLPYASIYLAGKGIGTVTNDKGEFLLKLDAKYLTDTVNVSCIGYKSQRAAITLLINANRDFLLKPDVVSIQEVIIRKINPVSLLLSAQQNIPDNYPDKPAILSSFYRESIKKGNRYMMVSEAVLENYKSGYSPFSGNDQVRIVKGRKTEDISPKDSVVLKMKAGLSTMLLLDVVKNMPEFMTGDDVEDYNYTLADIVVENGREQYAIAFEPRPGSLTAVYSGRILLDVRNLAYTWVEFSIDEDKLEQATHEFVLHKPAFMKVKVLRAGYKVAFHKTGDRYYLRLIQTQTAFRIRDKHSLTGSVYTTRLEMAVTDIDTVHVNRFKIKEAAKPSEFFTDQLGKYDEQFWGEYNFIRPEESLEDALAKLMRIKRMETDEAGIQ